jgi:hypothetical protein
MTRVITAGKKYHFQKIQKFKTERLNQRCREGKRPSQPSAIAKIVFNLKLSQ